jgi:PAS domain S-box-containing protein
MNPLLKKQLQQYLGESPELPENLVKLLDAVSESYDRCDKDRKLIECSIELNLKEKNQLNIELEKEKEDLKKAHKELNTLFKNINEVLFSVDMVEYRLTQMSAACEKVYGYTQSEFFADGDLWQKVIHAEDRHKVWEQLKALDKGEQVANQYRIIHKNNSIRWVENHIVPTRNESGRLIRMDGITSDITNRKLAELELEKSFSIIEATLQSTADGILVVDKNNRITAYNNKFLEIWQIPKEILDSGDEEKTIQFVQNQLEDPDGFVARLEQLYNCEKEGEFDLVNFKDGRVIERYSQPQLINKKYAGRVWSFRDVTERNRAEEIIRLNKEKLSLIMNSALDAIICFELNGNISFWNQQAEAIFGWKENEVMGKELSEFIIPEEFREKHRNSISRYLETGQAPLLNTLLELTALKKSGERFPIELAKCSIKQDAEEFFCVFIRDISQRKKAEEAIVKSNERHNLVAKATNDVIWDWDLKTNQVVRSAENMKKILGYDVEESNETASFWSGLIHPEDKQKIDECFEIFNDPGQTYMDSEYRLRKADGQYAHIYDKGYIIRDTNGKAIRMIGASQDITKLKENELQLKKHAKELATSNEELEQFAYIASHDLQEPLRMVTSFLTQLEKKYGDILDEKGKRYIDFAVDGAKRMRQIILDLLDYSRAGRNKNDMEEIDLNELIGDINILFRKEIEEKKAVIRFDELPVLTGYSAPLRQVFQNVIGNALKYCRQDVPVEIAITAHELADHWHYSVADNGIGIDKEYFDRIFVIFQRLHNRDEYSGTGLGLAITKKIIENMGGKIWVSSEEGKGSTFYFTILKQCDIN